MNPLRFTMGLVLLGFVSMLPACGEEMALCTAPDGQQCVCPSDVESGSGLVLLTDGDTTAFSDAMDRIARPHRTPIQVDAGTDLASIPVLTIATYGNTMGMNEVATLRLDGDPTLSERRRDADALLQATCLKQAAEAIGEPSPGATRLLGALGSAAQRAGDEGALLVFGFGRTTLVQDLRVDAIDLSTPQARQKVVDELRRVHVLGPPASIPIVFLAPGAEISPPEHIDPLSQAGFIELFVTENLCPALTTATCMTMAVLP